MTCKYNLTVFALFLVLNSIAIVSLAQSGETVAIHLKDGDVRIGRIIQTDSLGSVKLLNDCGIFSLKKADIEKIITVTGNSIQGIDQAAMPATNNLKPAKEKKWYNLTSVGLLMGQGQNGFIPVPSLTNVTGIRLGPRVLAGVGVGYEYYDRSVIPVFADVKYSLDVDRTQPFFSIKLGYGFPVGEKSGVNDDYYNGEITDYYGGLQLNPEVGFMFKTSDKDALVLSLGYHFQQLSYKYNSYLWWGYQYNNKTIVHTDYNRISFRLGYMF